MKICSVWVTLMYVLSVFNWTVTGAGTKGQNFPLPVPFFSACLTLFSQTPAFVRVAPAPYISLSAQSRPFKDPTSHPRLSACCAGLTTYLIPRTSPSPPSPPPVLLENIEPSENG